MVKGKDIYRGVRIRLTEDFVVKCIGDEYLKDEPVLFVDYGHVYNDELGEWCFVRGGSLTNSGRVYLKEIELVNPIPEHPLYTLYGEDEIPLGMTALSDVSLLPPHYKYQRQPSYQGSGVHNVVELEKLLEEYKEYVHQQAIIKQELLKRINND